MKYHMSVNVNMTCWIEAESEAEALKNIEEECYDYCEHIASFDSADIIEVKK
jgi:hypothetical protein